jgi:hypothetical protein
MARPEVVDGGEGLQIWRAAVNVLNMHLRTAEKGCLQLWKLARNQEPFTIRNWPVQNLALFTGFIWLTMGSGDGLL